MTEIPIFDIHHHVGALDISKTKDNRIWKSQEDYARRIQIMDKFGVKAAAVMPSSQYQRPNGIPDTCALNDPVADYRNRYRDRFPMAMGTVEPLYGEETGVRGIRRITEEAALLFSSERVIFDTDLHLDPVMYQHPHVLYEISEAPTLTEQDKQDIFWNNAQGLFKFAG